MRGDMRARVITIIVATVLAASCASPTLEYARERHPGCQVDPVAERGDAMTVQVACPGEDPVVRTYRGGR